MKKRSIRVEEAHLRDLKPDPENVRRHNPRNIGVIVESLQAVGAGRSVVLDEDNVLLAGNGVHEAAAEAGIERVVIVDAPGDALVAVRRHGLTPEQKRRLAIADNRANELSEWDPAKLASQLAAFDGSLIGSVGFTAEELAALMPRVEPHETEADPDAVPDERPTAIEAGDLFRLGDHYLLCGDATRPGDVARVMGNTKAVLLHTDPPCGVKLDLTQNHRASNQAKGIQKKYREFGPIANDDMDEAGLERLLTATFAVAEAHLLAKAAYYVWHPTLSLSSVFFRAAAEAGLLVHRQIVWVKPHFVFGRGDYHWRHELCFYGWRKGSRPKFLGEHNQDTVWTLDEGGGSIRRDQIHPSQKPVELFIRPIRNHCKPGSVIYEPFSGSGSQIIAAEQCGVSCRAIELKPSYVQQSIDRWERFTGKTAEQVEG